MVPLAPQLEVTVRLLSGATLAERLSHLVAYALRASVVSPAYHPHWLYVLKEGLDHVPFVVEAMVGKALCGMLPLVYMRSSLFGRYLVSLPYLNSGGAIADDERIRRLLVDQAVLLADQLNVKHLELRHESPVAHPALTEQLTSKVHMRLPLPDFPGPLWESFPAKVRNQIRKGEKSGLKVEWGREELLEDFYRVFARNMRDLGTPVYGRRLFSAMLRYFGDAAEFCIVRAKAQPIAGAILIHGKGMTEVPSASSLREFNHTSANMLMYWQLLDRSIQRGQKVFDFGRSTIDSNTFKFKKQWGAEPHPAVWQYYQRFGKARDLRPDSPRYQRLIQIWQRMPVRLTRWIGPRIVRGIP